jgi:hypothetical protein
MEFGKDRTSMLTRHYTLLLIYTQKERRQEARKVPKKNWTRDAEESLDHIFNCPLGAWTLALFSPAKQAIPGGAKASPMQRASEINL